MVIAEPTRSLDILEEPMQPALTALLDDEPQPDLTASARDLVALLFAAAVPLEVGEVQRLLDLTPQQTDRVLGYLAEEPPLGLRVQRFEDRLQLTTEPASAAVIERFLGAPPPVRLSRAALEALAVVAYRQPVTRGDIDAVRGVNSDSAVTTLLSRNLVVEIGRKDTVGRPALLAVSSECLQYLGISSLTELPQLPDGSLPTAATTEEPKEAVAPNGAVHDGLEVATEQIAPADETPHDGSEATGAPIAARADATPARIEPAESSLTQATGPMADLPPAQDVSPQGRAESPEAQELRPDAHRLGRDAQEVSPQGRAESPEAQELRPDADCLEPAARELSREAGERAPEGDELAREERGSGADRGERSPEVP